METIIRLAVMRPVATTMAYLGLLLVGLVAIMNLPRELFPTVTFPELLVVTRYGAAAPEEIENIITKVVEEQAGTVPNLRKVNSISREGISVVMLEFNWGTDMAMAHLSVREKVDLIKDRLPSEAEEPIIERYNPFAQPMMILSVSGEAPLHELTRLATDVIKKRLQKVDGVAAAVVSGGQEREILVEIDLEKMDSSNISISGVVDSLKSSNINYPAGTTQGRFYEYVVRTIGEFKSVDEIGRTVVAVDSERSSQEYYFKSLKERKGADSFQPTAQRLVPLSSIGEVKDTFSEARSYARYNGRPNVSIALQKQFDGNTIQVAKRIRRALGELAVTLPNDMKVDVIYDESIFISNSLTDVVSNALAGGVLAFLVLLFFLRKLSDAVVVTLALPMSFLFVFVMMYFFGRTINVISLAGISLAIGGVVDNAICVLDNIVKKRDGGMEPKDAAVSATTEVAVAQLASMLTNIVVFLPLLFAKGLAQQLFMDLFFTAVVANIAALVIALTLVPRIAAYSKALKAPEKAEDADMMIGMGGELSAVQNQAVQTPEGTEEEAELDENGNPRKRRFWLFEGITPTRRKEMYDFYRKILVWALEHYKQVMAWTVALFVVSIVILIFKEKIMMPTVDQGQFMIRISMPVGTRLSVTNRVMERIEKAMSEMKEVKETMARVGSSGEEAVESLGTHQAECTVTINRETAKGPTETVILKAKAKIDKEVNLEGAEMEILLQDSSMKAASGGSAPVAVVIKGPDLGVLRKMADDIQLMLRGVDGVEGVKSSMALPSFETRVSIDKDRSSTYSLSVSEIARAALIGIRGFVATYLKEEGKEYPVRVRLREEYRNEPAAIRRISIRSPQGVMVPLGDVATITGERGPSEIQRIDQQRAVTITAQVFGRGVGEVSEEVDRKLEPYRSTKDYAVELGGAQKEAQESMGGLIIAFVFAIVLTYMIMAAGFESLFHPFLIMMTVPLGVIGVAFTVLITFIPLSAPVWLALVLLGGIVVNNGIVLIDHVNELRSGQGMELYEAIVHGCVNRLQPVLMTALVATLSLLPSAVAWGEGTEMSAPMAMATLGGLFISTPLTLLIIPILYYRAEKRILEKKEAKEKAESEES